MENLNAEQIKKALECCIVNDWNSTKCNECPIYNGGGGCIDELKQATLALITSQEQKIKELTEENEILKMRRVTIFERIESHGIGYRKGVQRMQERLCEGRVSNDPVVIATNSVVKEMLEDGI